MLDVTKKMYWDGMHEVVLEFPEKYNKHSRGQEYSVVRLDGKPFTIYGDDGAVEFRFLLIDPHKPKHEEDRLDQLLSNDTPVSVLIEKIKSAVSELRARGYEITGDISYVIKEKL
jgi:hypothetical protein